MSATRTIDPKDALNRAMPANARAQLGDVIDELITKHNALPAERSFLRKSGPDFQPINRTEKRLASGVIFCRL